MRVLGYLILSSSLLLACGSSEDDGGGGKGGTGAKDAGTGGAGATGGTGATGGGGTGGSGLSGGSGGTGGSTGGSAGATGGTAGATGGTAGATGGAAGASGGAAGGGGTAGAASAQPECADATDCKVVNDCCTCEALPNAETPATCSQTCFQDKCNELGTANKTAECIAGRCVIGFDCTSAVICADAPPTCGPGTVPLIAAGCYQGSCVPADECASVKSCADCTGPLACANYGGFQPKAHCVEIPTVCGADASCACMGPSVCITPFDSCNDLSGPKGVSCGCPVC
jgi:hypothetical protein